MAKKTKKQKKSENTEPFVENIIDFPMEEIMGERFGIYAKELFKPGNSDARDGLKTCSKTDYFLNVPRR